MANSFGESWLPGFEGSVSASRQAGRLRVLVAYNDCYLTSGPDAKSVIDILDQVNAIIAALGALGHDVARMPFRGHPTELLSVLSDFRPDVVFNMCEDVGGMAELELTMPSLLDMLGVPYTGSPPLAIGLCWDKALTKTLLRGAGLPTAAWCTVRGGRFEGEPPPTPCIVKPTHSDASVGVTASSVVASVDEALALGRKIEETYKYPALVESFVSGREINITVMGVEQREVLPMGEVDYSALPPHLPAILTYGAKWEPEDPHYERTPIKCPAELEPGLAAHLRDLAIRAAVLTGCRGYCRVDTRVDETGQPFILEVNPNPCLASDAGVCRAALASGLTYPQLIGNILALARCERRKLSDAVAVHAV